MTREWLTSGTVERSIGAPAADVYRVLTDVTSTGDRSTECVKAEWLGDSARAAVVGARFRGYNRSRLARWSRVCEVTDARPGAAFAFRTVPERWDPSRRDSSLWRYELVPDGDRTLVRHSYEIVRMPLRPFKALYGRILPHHRDMRPAMRHTLDALAASLDSPTTTDTEAPRQTTTP